MYLKIELNSIDKKLVLTSLFGVYMQITYHFIQIIICYKKLLIKDFFSSKWIFLIIVTFFDTIDHYPNILNFFCEVFRHKNNSIWPPDLNSPNVSILKVKVWNRLYMLNLSLKSQVFWEGKVSFIFIYSIYFHLKLKARYFLK